MAAIKRHRLALQYASDELRNDRAIVAAALAQSQDVSVLQYASHEIRADPAFLMVVAARKEASDQRKKIKDLEAKNASQREELQAAQQAIREMAKRLAQFEKNGGGNVL